MLSKTVFRVRAGLQASLRMSRQMAPFALLTFGCQTWGVEKSMDICQVVLDKTKACHLRTPSRCRDQVASAAINPRHIPLSGTEPWVAQRGDCHLQTDEATMGQVRRMRWPSQIAGINQYHAQNNTHIQKSYPMQWRHRRSPQHRGCREALRWEIYG